MTPRAPRTLNEILTRRHVSSAMFHPRWVIRIRLWRRPLRQMTPARMALAGKLARRHERERRERAS